MYLLYKVEIKTTTTTTLSTLMVALSNRSKQVDI